MKKFVYTLIMVALLIAPVSSLQAAQWTVDAGHTQVFFKVKHMMVTWVRGQFEEVESINLSYDGKSLESASVNADINIGSIDTGNEDRDKPGFHHFAQ